MVLIYLFFIDDPTTLSSVTTATTTQAPAKYLGCYIDSRNDRDLNGYSTGRIKTNEHRTCFNNCYSKQFKYAGLQYG